jgi:hypothetical protein
MRYRANEVVGLDAVGEKSASLGSDHLREERRWALTDFGDERLEFGVAGEGNDQALDGSDGGRKGEDSSVDVVGTSPVRVFEKRVEDSTDTERRLDNVGNEFANWA